MKGKFKIQIEDLNPLGQFIFEPTYHEHHRSYLREIFEKNEPISDLKSLTFYGLQGAFVSQGDIDLVKSKIPEVSTVFI